MLYSCTAAAVTGVNPFGVNVRTLGPTSVFLTFQNLDTNETAVDAFWCGELTPAVMATNPDLQLPFAVQFSDPCVPGTVFGRLPTRLNQAQDSTSGAFTNLTDIMTIPTSVSRRAYQDAAAGKNSAFFYVRHFSGGTGGDKFVIVTCRMAGGGARVALALMNVRLAFRTEGGDAPVLVAPNNQPLPPFGAEILYNGSGILKGRWEVVMPGDIEPSEEDLLTEATLPVEKRGLQRRYTLIDRFELYLPPTGKVYLKGPDPKRLPNRADGPYKVLLRIEATDDKESTSNTGDGRIANAGGVAGFPMPVLRYYIGAPESLEALAEETAVQTLGLFLPQGGAEVGAGSLFNFSWVEQEAATLYLLEVESDGDSLLSAAVKPGVANYTPPPWLTGQHAGKTVRWRVSGLDHNGNVTARSEWRELRIR
jgi:hypothetical protein